jgi:hypothetical protein
MIQAKMIGFDKKKSQENKCWIQDIRQGSGVMDLSMMLEPTDFKCVLGIWA